MHNEYVKKKVLVCTHCNIGGGDNARFWQDKWCGDKSLMSKMPMIYAMAQNRNLTVGEAFIETSNRV